MSGIFDVAIIGAGVVGAAIARELSRCELDVVLIDAASDVGSGTSKANTAILHTGFDAPPGSVEARLVARGYELLRAYADAVGIAYDVTGALLVAWTEEEAASFPDILAKARANGVLDLVPVKRDELYRLEPHLAPGALGALKIPGEGIICPYSPPLAYAYEAVENGVTLALDAPVVAVKVEADATRLDFGGQRAPLSARWVVNAAGLHSDTIDHLFGGNGFHVRARRGQLIVFDKLSRQLVQHVLLPVPTKRTKGVLISPTVFGNVLLGPTAEDLDDKDDRATTASGMADLMAKGRAMMPALLAEEVTATYAGLRAATEHQDYQIRLDASCRYWAAGGIRSTGLSASLALAELAREQLAGAGVPMRVKAAWRAIRMPSLGDSDPRPYFDEARVAKDPNAGAIVCHCEKVTRSELLSALRAPIPARTLDGLRRRTRCLQGRCQGFYCLAEVTEILGRGAPAAPR